LSIKIIKKIEKKVFFAIFLSNLQEKSHM